MVAMRHVEGAGVQARLLVLAVAVSGGVANEEGVRDLDALVCDGVRERRSPLHDDVHANTHVGRPQPRHSQHRHVRNLAMDRVFVDLPRLKVGQDCALPGQRREAVRVEPVARQTREGLVALEAGRVAARHA
eukprot:3939071-Rhodomonas_salina.1